MDAIQIKNLRRLGDTGKVELKPITLLVGANSSGKSTFLRTFPLWRQSVNAKIIGPILWYGNEVDFGSFESALKRGESMMEFTFFWSRVEPSIISRLYARKSAMHHVSLRIHIEQGNEDALITYYEVTIGDNTIVIQKDGDKPYDLILNGNNLTKYGDLRVGELYKGRNVLPELIIHGEEWGYATDIQDALIERLRAYIKETNLSEYAHLFDKEMYATIDLSYRKEMAQQLIEKMNAEHVDAEQLANEDMFKQFVELYILSCVCALNSNINDMLKDEFNMSYYIKPFRASAERYYRWQNLAVDILDSDGHNMAMFVKNMYKSRKTKNSFIEWTNKFFGFGLDVVSIEGHLSLTIKESDGEEYNIADKGYGYSQVMPVILTLWQIYYKYANTTVSEHKSVFIAIEQPELHLHPKMQAKLMDAFIAIVNTARENSVDIKFIIETHSQIIVNRLGLKIARRQYAASQASVLLFHDVIADGQPSPQVAVYDNEGILCNWPAGFFDVE